MAKMNLTFEQAVGYLEEKGGDCDESIAGSRARFPDLLRKTERGADGTGEVAFALVGGARETGRLVIIFAIERGRARRHSHKPDPSGASFRERIRVVGGCIRTTIRPVAGQVSML